MKRAIVIFLLVLSFSVSLPATDRLHLTTVVIDAGHGGKDPGAVSGDRKVYEKNIVLDIALRLAGKIRAKYPEVKVILTRDSDVFIPLNTRADIANKAGADLFISIHVNAARNTSASGYSVHVMGQSRNKGTDLYELNMESVKRENSVIRLEDDYTLSYEGFDPSDPESYIFLQLMQNAYLEQSLSFAQTVDRCLRGSAIVNDRGIWQNPFLVLWKTSMPSVLIELGFISNAADLSKMKLQSTREDLASRLAAAFEEYKMSYDRSLNAGGETPADSSGTARPTSSGSSLVLYGVQIFAVKSGIDPKSGVFLGYTPEVYRVGQLRKYVIAVADDPSVPRSKLAEIRKKYPEAFVVKIENGVPTVCR